MALMKRPRLSAIEPLPNYQLKMTFINGTVLTVDKGESVFAKPGLAPLRDPTVFAKAELAHNMGWTVEWPDYDIQIGADTLWLEAMYQAATDENTRTFLAWRLRNGLSLAEAAQALGMTTRTISAYGTGARPVPHYIALACKGWESENR
ncbi:MAG: DUF2442 domain-containing protein [Methylobacter sp.]|nr:DUF2442 domain-containing protein [Methylobacter sp.]MDP2097805.1 DUF2442 domain-containing protein [Methylobacter sp.]MDP2429075.1 DUF2442 domain-containing protein [Methylobacter sp.]MDP3054492.1 DUF2442 domain-containing protein [Methylobacter sp.]MDP3362387.1 DUF2442 domain-containing protein [Methylobacter sp.]